MPPTLGDIVGHKKLEVRALRASAGEAIERHAERADAVRPWPASGLPEPLAIIAEIKRMSPSAGLIRPDPFDPAAIAGQYADNGASAISCLTDEKFFGGSLEALSCARRACGLPVLRKDFILDPVQVAQARAANADAVLLIAECLPDDGELAALVASARRWGMAVLLECFSEGGVRRLAGLLESGKLAGEGLLLGINNRDLETMRTEPTQGLRLAPLLLGAAPLVAESGIRQRADLDRYADAGFAWALVGEHLMRQPSPGAALAALLGRPAQPEDATGR